MTVGFEGLLRWSAFVVPAAAVVERGSGVAGEAVELGKKLCGVFVGVGVV